jgi:hypothetical protein
MSIMKPLELVTSLREGTRLCYTTKETASLLNLREDTLRAWACFSKGSIQPKKVGNRLAWKAEDIRNLLGLEVV